MSTEQKCIIIHSPHKDWWTVLVVCKDEEPVQLGRYASLEEASSIKKEWEEASDFSYIIV